MKKLISVFAVLAVAIAVYGGRAQGQASNNIDKILGNFSDEAKRLNNMYTHSSCSVSAEFSNHITVTVQAKRGMNNDEAQASVGTFFFSTSAVGADIVSTSNDPQAVTVATDGAIRRLDPTDALSMYFYTTETDGDLDFVVWQSGDVTLYVLFEDASRHINDTCTLDFN